MQARILTLLLRLRKVKKSCIYRVLALVFIALGVK